MAAMFAAAMHDMDHLGVSNHFLVKTQHPMAIAYNNTSVLENHHVATSSALIDQYMTSFSSEEKRIFKKIVTEMILATDLANHHDLLSRFLETGEGELSVLLHAADVSSCARPWPIASRWTERIMEEFFAQGDQERQLGWESLSPLTDRNTCNIPRVQLGFIDVVARPLLTLVAPPTVVEELERNRAIWESMDSGSKFI